MAIRSTVPQGFIDDVYGKWKARYLQQAYQGRIYINFNLAQDSDPPNAVTTSESIGYGMLISVLRKEEADFQGLLLFYNDFINPTFGLMRWQVVRDVNGKLVPRDGNSASATDGDMDVAYALFKAEKVWPGSGYKKRALDICGALLMHCIKAGESHMPMVGDFAGPDATKRLLSRSSDWMLTHFQVFEQEDTANASQWRATFEKTVAAYHRNLSQHPTGLLADFYVYDEKHMVYDAAPGRVHETDKDGAYWMNACRVPWRLAAYWKANDQKMVEDVGIMPAMDALKVFFEKEADKGQVEGGYHLDGRILEHDDGHKWTTNAFLGPAWCLLKVMGSSRADFLETKVKEHLNDRYYADSILLLSMLETL